MPPVPKYRNMRGILTATVIEVLEGDGDKRPYEIVKYVVIDGKIQGIVKYVDINQSI